MIVVGLDLTPEVLALAAALQRHMQATGAPAYLRAAAEAWLATVPIDNREPPQ